MDPVDYEFIDNNNIYDAADANIGIVYTTGVCDSNVTPTYILTPKNPTPYDAEYDNDKDRDDDEINESDEDDGVVKKVEPPEGDEAELVIIDSGDGKNMSSDDEESDNEESLEKEDNNNEETYRHLRGCPIINRKRYTF